MFLRRISVVYFIFFSAHLSLAALDQFSPGARSGGLGLAFVALVNDPTALVKNPAGLSFTHSMQGCSFYSRPYGLKELETTFFGVSFSRHRLSFGFGFQRFGFSRYRENTFYGGVSWRSTPRFFVGASLFWGQVQIPGYWSAHALGLNLGYFFQVSPRLSFAGSVQNATYARLARGENLPQELNAGLAYHPAQSALVSVQISKSSRFPASLRVGAEWTFFRRLVLRSGFLTQPTRFTAGFGFHLGHFRLDYAYLTHAVLGGTHQFSVSFTKK